METTYNQDAVNLMLDKFGLNWNVNKLPLSFSGKDSGFMGLVREDNSKCFAAVKPSYEVFQNSQLAELLFRLADKTGHEIYNGGMFGDGAKVYLQLKIDEVKNFAKNNDRIDMLATAINFHDYNGSMKWGHTNTTISCGNTFNYVSRELKSSARHSKNMIAIIDAALRDLEVVQMIEKGTVKKYSRMAEVEVKKANIIDVVFSTTGVDMTLTAEELKTKYKTVSLDKMNDLLAVINSEMEEKGETLWGLFSGVTKYTQYSMPMRKEDKRTESKYMGRGFEIDNKAFASLSLA